MKTTRIAVLLIFMGAILSTGAAFASTPKPTFTPNGGTFSTSLQVTIAESLAGATIYYTTDGSNPTSLSPEYSESITVAQSETIKALAYVPGSGASEIASTTFSIGAGIVPTPAISPDGGTFNSAQQVSITDALEGATILYTTDGTAPTSLSNVYSAPFTVSSTESVRAIAYQSGYTVSGVGLATFVISAGATPTPQISPNGGHFSAAQQVTITDSIAGATIFYTTDGSSPTSESPQYTGPITVSSSEVVKAFAYQTGYTISGRAEAAFIISLPQTPTPQISPNGGTFSSAQQVTITDSLADATIFYTIDGSTPTSESSQYSAPITVSSSGVVKAFAYESGYTVSEPAVATFSIILPQTPTPTITPNGGTFSSPQQVTITDSLAGATIVYSTNGLEPTSASTQYTGPITVSATSVIKARAFESGYSVSGIASATFAISAGVTPTPTISPNGGTFSTAQQVTITDSLVGATIFYTVDGSTPTSQSSQYTGPITVSSSGVIRAFDYESGYMVSGPAYASFTISAGVTPTPVISPNGGTYSTAQQVTITDSLAGATIIYTTDGTEPTSLSTVYNGPITVSSTETIRARAYDSGYTVSAIASATFTISGGIHTFPAGLALISTPTDYAGQSLDSVLGYASPKLAIWDPVAGQYDVTPTPPADVLHVGYGYWIRFPDAETIEVAGTPTPTDAPFVITLGTGWNMIGDPFPADELLNVVTVTPSGGSPESLADAITSGLIGASLFGYTPTGYYVTDRLSPYQGYWITATAPCTLSIPVASAPPPPPS